MADTNTTNLNLTKPEVGASSDTWGTKVNANFDAVDQLFDAGPALKVAKGGTGATTSSGARTNLGLGSIATQNANAVAITGGTVSGIADLAVADGGTGASDAAGARTNLGLGALAVLSTVGASEITDGAVGTAELADGAVTTAKVADGSITAAKLATGAVPSSMPSGAVIPFAGSTEPSGWLFCFGQAISRTTYAELFAAVSTTYGVGDGSTTFNLPDLRGRVVAGQDDMGGTSANRLTNQTGGLDGDVLGATGGAETHTLTIAQMPAHTHTAPTGLSGSGSTNLSIGSGSSGTSSVTGSQGSGNAHNNVQPTIILNYIIKV
jgi:microcystin-dependent protein